ncbi:MAG: portal protein [Muricauda sp. TMED12]|nr:MAG: portal protein [Muricauda sp. TMED12]
MAEEQTGLSLFGFEIKRRKSQDKEDDKRKSFVAPQDDDGTAVVAGGGHYGQYLDIDASNAKDDKQLITRYRDAAIQPECDAAVEDIVNEAIVSDDDSAPIDIVVDDVEAGDKVKDVLKEEFTTIVKLLNFNNQGHDIFRKWYVDGRLFYHIIVDEKNPGRGIIELRPIDSTKIRKVKKVIEDKDPKTGLRLIKGIDEHFVFQDAALSRSQNAVKISKDAICYVTSGMLDPSRKKVLSYLHKALKPVNQLRMMEDSLVIYRISRAPERRIFYVDVGNLPKGKADEYMQNIMSKHRNKLVYDAQSGDIRDDRKHQSMLEDFWIPRREGGRGTEITTLPGGENLGQIDDIIYFQKKLYKSLNVPVNRLEQEAQFSLGRSSEITRDELKFQKFINRLRKRFTLLFFELMKSQLIIKGLMTEEEWNTVREQINFDFIQDTHFAELKEAELLRERMATLREIDDYVGKYYSVAWVRKNVLQQNEDDIEEIGKQIADEQPEEEEAAPDDGNNDQSADDLASRGF